MARERIPEHRLVGNSLRSCVEARRQLLQGLLPPPWNEPPAHRDELDPASGCGSHDFYRVGRSDVVVGLQIASRAVREFVQILDFIPSVALHKSPHIASTHQSWAARASRPAPVILIRTTSIALSPAFMFSRRAIASPLRIRPAIMSLSNQSTSTRSSSVAPCGRWRATPAPGGAQGEARPAQGGRN